MQHKTQPSLHCAGSWFSNNNDEETLKLKAKIEALEKSLSIAKGETTNERIYRVVLTGGPCGGKSTAMNAMREKLENAGYRVYRVPEAATLLFGGGAQFGDFAHAGEMGMFSFQMQITKLQVALENAMFNLAKAHADQPSVILCDRGLLDGKAYVPSDVWPMILEELSMTVNEARDKRYDAVVHLVTAAKGAEKYYTLANNEARTETAEEARALDERTAACWYPQTYACVIHS